MSEQPIDEYLTLDFFKLLIGSTDTQDDDRYHQFVTDANKKVQTALFRYIDTPLGGGSPYFSRARDAALAYARSLHAIDQDLIDHQRQYLTQYNFEMYGDNGTESDPKAGGLIQELRGTRTNRTRTVLVTKDPREFKVPLPTQNDIFTFDRFA